MNHKELYEQYKTEPGVIRKVSFFRFRDLMYRHGSYEAVVKELSTPKAYVANRKGVHKATPSVVVDFAKKRSVKSAAKHFQISERTVYRYKNQVKGEK